MKLRRTLVSAAGSAAAGGLIALAAAPASAHVTIDPDTTSAGGYALLTVSVPHGCDGSPTTKVAIAMPEDVPAVTPTRNALWEVTKKVEKLDTAITDAHGNQITERVSQVVYTAKSPLPDGYRDAFELSVQLPDAAGETLTFPVVQSCEKGQTGWTETPAEGQDAEDLEHPAPQLTVTAAEGIGQDGTAAGAGEAGAGGAATDEAGDTGDGNGLAIAGLVAGVLGLVVGGAALARGRRA